MLLYLATLLILKLQVMHLDDILGRTMTWLTHNGLLIEPM